MNTATLGLSPAQLRSPLARRLILAIVLTSSAITLLLTALQLYAEYRAGLGQIEAAFRQIREVHLQSLSQSLWQTNAADVQLQLDGIVRLPNIEYAAVREGDKVWAQAGQRASRSAIERRYAMTFAYRGQATEIGALTVVAGVDLIYRELALHALTILASNALKTFLVATVAFLLFHRLVNRHLLAIADYFRDLYFTGRVAPLKLAHPAGRRPDELDQVCAVINLLQERSQEMRSALEESEAGLRRAQSMARLAHVVTGPDGIFERFSDNLPQMAGLEPRDMPRSTRGWLKLIHPQDREAFRAKCVEGAVSGEWIEIEYRLQRADGAWLQVHQTAEPLDAGPTPARWFSTLQDVTERTNAAQQLSRALKESVEQQAQLAAMARRLTTLQERERRDIARELHDRVGQNLTALSFNLQWLHDGPPASDEARRKVADSLAILRATGATIADVLTELKPAMLANYGLLDALRFHAREFTRRTGLAVEVDGREERFAPDFEMALFRIAQAALNNVLQHARAKSARISIERGERRLRLEIRDDGAGFDPRSAGAAARWGLSGMRERAEAIGGTLRLDAAPGRGTRIVVEVTIER